MTEKGLGKLWLNKNGKKWDKLMKDRQLVRANLKKISQDQDKLKKQYTTLLSKDLKLSKEIQKMTLIIKKMTKSKKL